MITFNEGWYMLGSLFVGLWVTMGLMDPLGWFEALAFGFASFIGIYLLTTAVREERNGD